MSLIYRTHAGKDVDPLSKPGPVGNTVRVQLIMQYGWVLVCQGSFFKGSEIRAGGGL